MSEKNDSEKNDSDIPKVDPADSDVTPGKRVDRNSYEVPVLDRGNGK